MCLVFYVVNLNIFFEFKFLEICFGFVYVYYCGIFIVCEFIYWNDRRKLRVFYKKFVFW